MSPRRVHLIGIGGAGMSAIAAVLALRGMDVSGSDRDHDRGGNRPLFDWLRDHGVRLFPQDGSGLREGRPDVVASGAVEAGVPELEAARVARLRVLHRSEILAELLQEGRGVAVAGTSGKSTVTAMIAWILEHAGFDPTFLGGAPLVGGVRSIARGAAPGPAAWVGGGGIVVAEADESDGSLVRYRPEVGVVTNVTVDHHPLPELQEMFRRFRSQVTGCLVLPANEIRESTASGAGTVLSRFGEEMGADPRAVSVVLERWSSRFEIGPVRFRLPLAGRFNVSNALAAVAVARHFGVSDPVAAQALALFPGLARRMERIGEARGVEVIDDFAHNPDKVVAALACLRATPGALRLVFQLHGFGPARMHRKDLVDALAAGLGPEDVVWLPPVFFAGGTVRRDVTEEDYAADLRDRGIEATAVTRGPEFAGRIAGAARAGDRIVIMGARDPTLPALARDVLQQLR